jgi:mono/diheme cytochrome c family protein
MRRAIVALLIGFSAPAMAQEGPTWVEVGAIFAERCVKCHAGPGAPMGLELDTYEHAMAGGWSGPVLISGDAVGSAVLRRLRGEAAPRMPLDGPPFLEDAQIAVVEAWVLAGLPQGDPAAAALAAAPRARPLPGEPVFYDDVEQIFMQRCIKCHSNNSKLGAPPEGLRLDSYDAILAGGERIVIVPGDHRMSELWRRIEGLAEERMPFDGPPWLADEDITMIATWIAQGARNPEGVVAPIPVGRELRLRGTMTGKNEIDGARFEVTGRTRIDDRPRIGGEAEMRGVVMGDGSVRATRLRDR